MTATEIKAIQTHYNGYHFRSRLEARYAVLFDAINLKYEYEAEGFELAEGRYLPDFWFPDSALYVEVKGQPPSEREQALCISLARETYCDVMILVGGIIQEDGEGHSPHYLYTYKRLFPYFARILESAPESVGWTKEHAERALERGAIIWIKAPANLQEILTRLHLDIRRADDIQRIMRSARFEFQNSATS